MFQEFPKHLTRGEEYRVVDDADGEAAARADGFRFWSDPPEVETKTYADGTEAAGPGPLPDESPAEPTVESVRAQLDAAGIDYDGRMGLKKLLALLPQ
jgi:hypothetical protein